MGAWGNDDASTDACAVDGADPDGRELAHAGRRRSCARGIDRRVSAPTPTAAACPTPPHGLASPAPDARSAVDGVVRGDDYEGVIFTGAAAEDLAYWFLYFAWTETWEPSAADVAALEAGVEAFLCAEPTAQRPGWDDRRPLWERIASHKRQYAGVVVEGRRLVLANFFCDAYDDGDDWLRSR